MFIKKTIVNLLITISIFIGTYNISYAIEIISVIKINTVENTKARGTITSIDYNKMVINNSTYKIAPLIKIHDTIEKKRKTLRDLKPAMHITFSIKLNDNGNHIVEEIWIKI